MTPAQVIDERPLVRRRPGLMLDTLTLSILATVAKLAGAAKSVAIAHGFGSGAALDSYLLAFLIPSVIADTFCGALVPVAVPRLIELEHRSGRAAWLSLYSLLFRRGLKFALLGSGGIAAVIATLLALGRGPETWHSVGPLALIMLPVIPCNAIVNVWRAVLNSQNRFAAPAATAIMTPAVIMAGAFLAPQWGGVRILAIATAIGATAEMAVMALAVRRCALAVIPWRAEDVSIANLRIPAFKKEYGYLVASAAVSGATLALGQVMASSLGGGSVAVLNYGTRLSGVLMSIGPAALAVAVLPHFSKIAAQDDWMGLKRSLWRVLFASAAASAGVAAIFIAASDPIIRLTLQHGAFTAADTEMVAAVQRWSLVQMPFLVGITLLTRVISVIKANRVLIPLCAATLALTLAMNYALMPYFGVAGIALSASVAQAMLFAALSYFVFGPSGARYLRGVF